MNISAEQLKEVLDKHLKWFLGQEGGERANLSGADLSGVNLLKANLYKADLHGANLSWANLSGADLFETDLSGANLPGANLSGANLSEANLSGANLPGANLSGANLSGADIYRTFLFRTNLSGAKNLWCPMACPDTGSFTGWKKAVLLNKNRQFIAYVIVKLRVSEDAKRSSATSRKCRCDKAEVLEIQALDGGKPGDGQVVSNHDMNFHYTPGAIVSVPNFDENRWEECSIGIHFFMSRQEAVNHMF